MAQRTFFNSRADSGLPPGESIAERQRRDFDEQYKVVRWSLIRGDGVMQRDTTFEAVVGTHLYCDSLHSPVPIAVRLGQKSNPFIPIEEGDTLIRPRFTGLTIRHLGPNNPDPGVTDQIPIRAQGVARFYVSTGELVRRSPDRRGGLQRGFGTFQIKRTSTVAFDLWNLVAQLYNLSTGPNVGEGAHLYRRGGFSLRNTSAVRWMVWWGQVGEADRLFPSGALGTMTTGWLILPGEIVTFDDTGSLSTGAVVLPTGAGTRNAKTSVLVQCESQPAEIQLLVPYPPYDTGVSEFNSGLPLPGVTE